MTEPPPLTDRDRMLLVALADGVLRGKRRAAAELRLRAIPDAARLLEHQRRVRRALHDGPVPLPQGAAAAVPLPAPTTPTAAAARFPRPRFLRPPALALAGGLTTLLVLVFALTGGADGTSVVAQAAALAEQPASAPAPASSGTDLRADVDGVAFPDWSGEFGWHATGERTDTIDGRRTRTVYYEHMGHRIAYTIIPGPPVAEPDGARIVHRDGVRIALDGNIAVFERDGRTCVLAGRVERTSTLVELAAWQAQT